MNKSGESGHEWQATGSSTNWCEPLPIGNLWMNDAVPVPAPAPIGAGVLPEYDWDGKVVWEHEIGMQNHDGRRLPNGGAVCAAFEEYSDELGNSIPGGIPGNEVAGKVFGEITREWRKSALIDKYPFHSNAVRRNYGHCDALDVLPDGHYLLLMKVLSLLLIVERSSGNVIWEFQNDDLGGQHDVQLTPQGTVLVFGNGLHATDLFHSSVWEIDPKSNEVVWKYKAKQNVMNFFSPHISVCQRLPSCNTLIAEGAKGCIFETTPDCEVVWGYVSPYWGEHPIFGPMNWMFRARRDASDSPEIQNRV